MPAVNYQRLRKIKRLIYSGYTLAQIAEECGLKKKQVKAFIKESNISDKTKKELKAVLKKNKQYSKKTLYIDTCGLRGENVQNVIKWFKKVVVIREVIDEIENHKYDTGDPISSENMRWFITKVADKDLNVKVVPTESVTEEQYTDNRLVDYLRKLPAKKRKKAVVITNDAGLACKLQAYGIDYFGSKVILERSKKVQGCKPKAKNTSEVNKTAKGSDENNSEVNSPKEINANSSSKAENNTPNQTIKEGSKPSNPPAKTSANKPKSTDKEVKYCTVPGVRLSGKTLYSEDNDKTIVASAGGEIRGPVASNMVQVRSRDFILKLNFVGKKMKIHAYKVTELLREKCAVDLGVITVCSKDQIQKTQYSTAIKSKLEFLFSKYITST